MNDTIFIALISAGFGLLGGAVTSLGAPWVNWGIEKRRDKMTRRRDLINNARLMFSGRTLRREEIRQSPAYGAIRPFLSSELTNNIGKNNISGGEQGIQDKIMQEVSALEKKWKLI